MGYRTLPLKVNDYIKYVVINQENLHMTGVCPSTGTISLHGTSKNGVLREEAIPIIPISEAPHQRQK